MVFQMVAKGRITRLVIIVRASQLSQGEVNELARGGDIYCRVVGRLGLTHSHGALFSVVSLRRRL